MIRCIVYYSTHEENVEGAYFTKDLTTDANDFMNPGHEVQADFTINQTFPDCFPLEWNLEHK